MIAGRNFYDICFSFFLKAEDIVVIAFMLVDFLIPVDIIETCEISSSSSLSPPVGNARKFLFLKCINTY